MLLHGEYNSAGKFHDWASGVIISYKKKIVVAIEKAEKMPVKLF
ncbi:MAG: hypothetical protein AABX16_00390 [Nanoarchaeota archaeon]